MSTRVSEPPGYLNLHLPFRGPAWTAPLSSQFGLTAREHRMVVVETRMYVKITYTLGCSGLRGGAVGGGTAGRSRVRFPVVSLEFFIDIILPVALWLWLTQPLTEMSTRNISWGSKGGRCVGLTTLPPSCADCLEIWESKPPGTLRACLGLQWDGFALYQATVQLWKSE